MVVGVGLLRSFAMGMKAVKRVYMVYKRIAKTKLYIKYTK